MVLVTRPSSPAEAGMISPRNSGEMSAALLEASKAGASPPLIAAPPPPPPGMPQNADAFIKFQQKEIEAQLNMLKARHLELMSKQQPSLSPGAGSASSRYDVIFRLFVKSITSFDFSF